MNEIRSFLLPLKIMQQRPVMQKEVLWEVRLSFVNDSYYGYAYNEKYDIKLSWSNLETRIESEAIEKMKNQCVNNSV
ncbi:hypothetical protein [Bacillus sp. ISL-39]|uniref:hypothetical protein n=1 Tax=Bacillus sp. ISL-39 TaxID=2819124 RepID=UPI001BE87BA4|nr:hypothetical protein [Bacillus sp. ISL-39]MBT2637013.1 hypothetical protein [Bacillus sp. ISL-39]